MSTITGDVSKVLARQEAWTLSELPSVMQVYDRAVVAYQQATDLSEQTKMLKMLTAFAKRLEPYMLQLVEKNAGLRDELIGRNAQQEIESAKAEGAISALEAKASDVIDQKMALKEKNKAVVKGLQEVKDKLLEMDERVKELASKTGVS